MLWKTYLWLKHKLDLKTHRHLKRLKWVRRGRAGWRYVKSLQTAGRQKQWNWQLLTVPNFHHQRDRGLGEIRFKFRFGKYKSQSVAELKAVLLPFKSWAVSDKKKRNIIHGKGPKIKDLFAIDMQCEKKIFQKWSAKLSSDSNWTREMRCTEWGSDVINMMRYCLSGGYKLAWLLTLTDKIAFNIYQNIYG